VPDDIYGESDSASGSDRGSECETGSEGSDSDDTAWVKVDKTPTLGHFTGNPGMKQILNPHLKLKYKAFLMNVAKDWAADKMEAAETEPDTHLVRPDCQLQLHVRLVWNKKYPTRKCRVCAFHKRKRRGTSASSA
jgi:hypothetical protein